MKPYVFPYQMIPYNKTHIYSGDNEQVIYTAMRSSERTSKRNLAIIHYATFMVSPETGEAFLLERESVQFSIEDGVLVESPTFIIESELRAMMPDGFDKLVILKECTGNDGIAPNGVVICPMSEEHWMTQARSLFMISPL